MHQLTQQSAGTQLVLSVADEFTLALPENRTTGFSWTVLEPCPILRLQSDVFSPPAPTPGAAGVRTWLFAATGAGSCTLQLQLRRSWQTHSDQPILVFPIRVSA